MHKGKVSVVGTGPGAVEYLTAQAILAIEECDLVIGYRLYVRQISGLLEGKGKEVIMSAMGSEIERCRFAASEALKGKKVALVSGGDPGIYGMAGLMLQVAGEGDEKLPVEIIPGITAAGAAAAVLGAPLMHDFAVISLSDLLTPWVLIEKRLHAAASADMVIVLYNPRSKSRKDLLARAVQIIEEQITGDPAVGLVRAAGREGQEVRKASLKSLLEHLDFIDMATLVIIGNSNTYWQDGKMITPRGYQL
ncbi:MAG: precorrin-3B C(17)-methyltransferase [Firmicutes bacterium]|nr:precorrin-3B C(17)-methyltransferase [Bacillota bacterium]